MRQDLYSGFDNAFHEEDMRWIHESDAKACFIAIADDGEVIGFLEVSLRNVVDGCLGSPVGYIEGVYLEPAHRGRGYGRAMIGHALEWFRTRGCSDMATDAEVDDIDAQRFYERAGFEETRRIVEYRRSLKTGY